MGFLRDGVIFNGPFWEFLLAAALGLLGLMMIRCGVNVCWTRFSRHPRQEPLEIPKQW